MRQETAIIRATSEIAGFRGHRPFGGGALQRKRAPEAGLLAAARDLHALEDDGEQFRRRRSRASVPARPRRPPPPTCAGRPCAGAPPPRPSRPGSAARPRRQPGISRGHSADGNRRRRLLFGFVSKYKKGATAPTGETEFQFGAAHLNFRSTTYQWLVVSGAKAQYKGTWTVNGGGQYGFILTAVDGQRPGGGGVDKLRMKIWDVATGATVYDTQMGADDGVGPTKTLGGGSIVVHNR